MGNPDADSPHKHLKTENISPDRSLGTTEDGLPITFDYLVLNQIIDTQKVAQEILTQEMREYLTKNGYEVVDWDSEEGQRVIQELEANINARLDQFGKQVHIGEGTPIMVERGGDSDPMRKINVIFILVKEAGKEKYTLFAHPVDLDERKVPSIPNQRRLDDQSFRPPIWPVEFNYPFGYRIMFPHIVSYPLIDK